MTPGDSFPMVSLCIEYSSFCSTEYRSARRGTESAPPWHACKAVARAASLTDRSDRGDLSRLPVGWKPCASRNETTRPSLPAHEHARVAASYLGIDSDAPARNSTTFDAGISQGRRFSPSYK